MKGNGNSRYLKTVGEALSLYPTYEDFLQAMIAGTFPVDFNGINKDGWTQLGTPLNKANLLSDTVISTLGLSTGANSTPNDAFNVLANVGNVHVWRKTVKTDEKIPATYSLGPEEGKAALTYPQTPSTQASFHYGKTITVDDNGTITINGEQTLSLNSDDSSVQKGNNLKGNFFYCDPSSTIGGENEFETGPGNVYFIPSDATISREPDTYLGGVIYTSKYQEVRAVPAVPPGTHVTYLTSVNRNAYQEGDDAKEAGYVLGDMVSGYLFASAWTGNASNYYYSETIKVSDTGTLTQENVKSYTANATNDSWVSNIQSAIRGKFITVSGEKDNGGSEGTNLVYIPDDAIVSYFENGVSLGYPYNYGFLVNKMQQVTGYPAIPAGTTIDYLGVLGEKVSVETGSYTGTGTYGSSNLNTIHLSRTPKLVFITPYNGANRMMLFVFGGNSSFSGYSGSASLSYQQIVSDGTDFSWYANNADIQLNNSGTKYVYTAVI